MDTTNITIFTRLQYLLPFCILCVRTLTGLNDGSNADNSVAKMNKRRRTFGIIMLIFSQNTMSNSVKWFILFERDCFIMTSNGQNHVWAHIFVIFSSFSHRNNLLHTKRKLTWDSFSHNNRLRVISWIFSLKILPLLINGNYFS